MLHRILPTLITMLLLLTVTSCGHGNNTTLLSTNSPNHTASSHATSIEKALIELDSMPCPVGVTPETWARVRDAFRKAAQDELSGKAVDQLRDYDEETAVLDLDWEQPDFNGPVTLTWGYVLPGDYNQNGLVEISDLTPLAQHLGETWAGGPDGEQYNSMAAVCDGSQDGAVHLYDPDNDPLGYIDDVMAMFQHFGDEVERYGIEGNDLDQPENASLSAWKLREDHEDAGPTPYQTRLRYSAEIPVNLFATKYYWVRPYDSEAPSNSGAPSNHVDLSPAIHSYKPQAPSGQIGSEITFSYIPNRTCPGPIVTQLWSFGDAATPSESNDASPTVTLTDEPGIYECNLKIFSPYGYYNQEYPYGYALQTFEVVVTTNQQIPVIHQVFQDSTEPGESATFSADITNLPVTTYEWHFLGGSATPDESSDAEPAVRLTSIPDVYYGFLQATNDAGTSPPFPFEIRVGYAPTDVAVTVPDSIVLDETATFTAECSPTTSPTVTYEWHFNRPDFDDQPSPNGADTVVITPHTYGGERHGYVIAKNDVGEVQCNFTYKVHWNKLVLRTELVWDDELQKLVEDTLPGEDGFVTVTAYIYDNGHPIGWTNQVYLEYEFAKVEPAGWEELKSLSEPYWPLWNAGCVGGDIWTADGWWQPYGMLFDVPRHLFFYRGSDPNYVPHPSSFPERQSTFHSVYSYTYPMGQYQSDIGLLGEDDYDPSMDIFNFRIYPAQGLLSEEYPFTTYITCFRYGPPPNNWLLTYYVHRENNLTFSHPFSNEPFVAIQGVAP